MAKHDLGKLVARGRTSDIHAWRDEQTVVKLYHDWFQLEWIKGEAARTHALQGFGLPIPKVGELIRTNDRNGLIFERIYGDNMMEKLMANPTAAPTITQRLADLHFAIHTTDGQPDIPELHEKLEGKIRAAQPLSKKLQDALIDRLHTMPTGSSICHGDFHPGNIVVAPNGASETVVDWNDCSFGNPLADVARSTVLFVGGTTGDETPEIMALRSSCHQLYLDRYFEISQADRDEYERWLPIVAGARLNEGITELEPWLLAEANKVLA